MVAVVLVVEMVVVVALVGVILVAVAHIAIGEAFCNLYCVVVVVVVTKIDHKTDSTESIH